ncbi:MAG TPA: hypothetical protein VD738_07670 [Nitrospira sp.]|jgi:hypothetical protein|nr:hypothetical protein [Nitrospira sp.]
MSEIVNCDKVSAVLLRHGEWYEVEPQTLTVVSAPNFLGGNPGTCAFAWKSHGTRFACPCDALLLVRYST